MNAISREDVVFDAGGERCAAWLYHPADSAGEPVPCVVLAHGLGGVRELNLDRFAERFAAAGFAALAFDYRCLGSSEGEPRGLIDPRRQVADYVAAVAYARSLPGVDPDRIVLWGNAFASGHVLTVAAADERIAAAISQLPYTRVSPRSLGAAHLVRIGFWGVVDEVERLLGKPPRMLDLIGPPGSGAVLTTHDSESGYRTLVPEGSPWVNSVAARFTLRAPLYNPGRLARKIQCPVLYCVADGDSICNPKLALKAARDTPRGELKRYPIGHFEICRGEGLERAAADQVEFLRRHVATPKARGAREVEPVPAPV